MYNEYFGEICVLSETGGKENDLEPLRREDRKGEFLYQIVTPMKQKQLRVSLGRHPIR